MMESLIDQAKENGNSLMVVQQLLDETVMQKAADYLYD